jgi:two-component system chemotaxis response regulator CheB
VSVEAQSAAAPGRAAPGEVPADRITLVGLMFETVAALRRAIEPELEHASQLSGASFEILVRLRRSGARPAPSASAPPVALRPGLARPPRLLAIGSSTGGPQALFTLIPALGKALSVPVVLTQHMPATFTPILAEHLGRLGGMPCAEARDGEALQPGHIYLAPGDRHLLIQRDATTLRARLSTDPPVNFCRPAVDPMLQSAASACEGRVLVVMLTGMGHDGREGTSAVVAAGGAAIAQDEESSVVWGMPGAIAQAKLCHAVLPLARIAPKVLEMIRR